MVTVDGFGAEYKSARDAIRAANTHNRNPYYPNKVDTIRSKRGEVLYRFKPTRGGYDEDGIYDEYLEYYDWVAE